MERVSDWNIAAWNTGTFQSAGRRERGRGLPAGLVCDAGLDGKSAEEDPDRGSQFAIQREGRQ